MASTYILWTLSATVIPITLFIWAILPARSSRTIIELPFSPNQITSVEILRLIILLVLKTLVPGFAPALVTGAESGTFILPDIELKGRLLCETKQIATFRQAVPSGSDHKLINPLFLFTQLNPLVVLILSHRRCPIKPLGSVNTHNVFTYIHPRQCCDIEALQSAGHAGRLRYVARFGLEPGLRHKRGIEFNITIEVFDAEELLLRLSMWFLQFLPSSFMPAIHHSQRDKQHLAKPPMRRTELEMTPVDPRRWAASCRDYNPIHVSRLGARLLGGYKGVIAHGNHVAALIIQQSLDASLYGSESRLLHGETPVELSVWFLRPVVLPTRLAVAWSTVFGYQNDFDMLVQSGTHTEDAVRIKVTTRPDITS